VRGRFPDPGPIRVGVYARVKGTEDPGRLVTLVSGYDADLDGHGGRYVSERLAIADIEPCERPPEPEEDEVHVSTVTTVSEGVAE
jgi:hypothetical protein